MNAYRNARCPHVHRRARLGKPATATDVHAGNGFVVSEAVVLCAAARKPGAPSAIRRRTRPVPSKPYFPPTAGRNMSLFVVG